MTSSFYVILVLRFNHERDFYNRNQKVTIELIYQVVDERTRDILEIVNDIKKRQEEDFRYLNQKMDTQIGQIRQELAQLNQKIDGQTAQLNQRIDTVIQLLIDIKK